MTLATMICPEPGQAIAMPSTRIALVVEYEGTDYYGFQLQAGQPTVQSELEKAILQLTGEQTRVTAASRTDTGVHALGQVVSFRTTATLPLGNIVSGLNYYLPTAIAVKEAHHQARGFHVQRTAVSRQYDYHILNAPTRSPLKAKSAYLVPNHLDVSQMQKACEALVGEHDFMSFTSVSGISVKSTVRRVYRADIRRDGELVIFTIVANSFLTHQVRNTVGALIKVGLGRMSLDEFLSIMERRQPGLAGPRAPSSGLYLVRVNYPRSFEEETDEDI
jgi:tRNA pseudouridine38-40 synthase